MAQQATRDTPVNTTRYRYDTLGRIVAAMTPLVSRPHCPQHIPCACSGIFDHKLTTHPATA